MALSIRSPDQDSLVGEIARVNRRETVGEALLEDGVVGELGHPNKAPLGMFSQTGAGGLHGGVVAL